MCRGVADKGYLQFRHIVFGDIPSVSFTSAGSKRNKMSYQVLARKWRPKNFSQVAGQAHVLKSLINALDNERLHHAYLFTGTRGVGKTTLARILAKCLNCETGVTSKPCEQCDSCNEINEGRFIDLIEVDAASRTKVEDTRELLDNVQYSPSRGRYKVYLIDEVHMLSNHSFNALLKTLEEPPPHVKFLFATTDPQKLPITILSRCLQFNLKNLSPQLIVEYLTSVLNEEKIEFDTDALWQIAAAATGSMRDALTLVDQAISYCDGAIKTDGVIEMLGIPDRQQVYAILGAMAENDMNKLMNLIREFSEQAPDFNFALDSLLAVLHRIAMAQVLPDGIDNSFGDREQIQQLASRFTAEDIQLYYQFGIKGRDDLRSAADLKSAFEMLLIRMMVFSPNFSNGNEAQQTSVELESATDTDAEDVTAEEKQKKKLTSTEADDKSVAQPEEKSAAPEAVDQVDPKEAKIAVEPEIDIKVTAEEPGRKDFQFSDRINHQMWLEIYRNLKISGIAANVLANAELKKVEGNILYFVLGEDQSAVYNEEILPKLSAILSDFFGQQVAVQIEIGKTENETPAGLSQRLKQERHEAMVSDFETDENVKELLKHFSGKVAKESIAPLKERGTK